MNKYVRLTESDIVRIINKIINEQDETNYEEPDPKQFVSLANNSKSNPQTSKLSEYEDEEDDFEGEF